MTSDGFKGISLPVEFVDQLEVLSDQRNLNLGRSKSQVCQRAIEQLVDKYRDIYETYQGVPFDQAVREFQKSK